MRRRLDQELVRRGLAESRTAAQTLIESGRVRVGGAPADKAARQVDPGDAVVVDGDPPPFVSRGGTKLDAALDAFGIDPAGAVVLDAGASTGGFTDCLLQRGAALVHAVDVGHGQLHERIRGDERVVVRERCNVRHLVAADLGSDTDSFLDGLVADLSFISLTKVLGALVPLVADGGWMVLLVKPQFEAGRRDVSRGRGVIREPDVWREALAGVIDSAAESGAAMMDVMASPIRGADGNTEFLVEFRRGAVAPGDVATRLDSVIASAAERGDRSDRTDADGEDPT